MGSELVIFLGVLAALGLVVFVIRRASQKQVGDAGVGARKRIRGGEEPEEDELDEDYEEDELEDEEEPDEGVEDEGDEGEGDRADGKRLSAGLAKTRGGFVARLGKLFSRKKIDVDVLDELEQVLFTADIGPKTANRLFESIKKELSKDELADPEAIWSKIREESATILSVDSSPVDFGRTKPFVLLTIGVNGVGKTTTIGKIAAKLSREGKKVLLAAGDTFRAAAVEQLEVWGNRADCPVVKGKDGGDPSSVIFDAIKQGVDGDYDVVIADTAGRLHTKKGLMEELQKVGRVCRKALEGAPHETWLVLDATTGQNAIQQAQLFKEAMDITGIVLTKLDGTAKGGVILGICDEMKVPVRFIGIGEQVDDLRVFDPEAFVDALYDLDEAQNAA
jgi:fused signal recognition particle receptor